MWPFDELMTYPGCTLPLTQRLMETDTSCPLTQKGKVGKKKKKTDG